MCHNIIMPCSCCGGWRDISSWFQKWKIVAVSPFWRKKRGQPLGVWLGGLVTCGELRRTIWWNESRIAISGFEVREDL
jgi:hypothetical protein